MVWENESWHYKFFGIASLILMGGNLLLVLTSPLWGNYFDVSSVYRFQWKFLIPLTQFVLYILLFEFLGKWISNLNNPQKRDIHSEYNLLGRFVLLGISTVILIVLSIFEIIYDLYLIGGMIVLFTLSIILGPLAGRLLRKNNIKMDFLK